MKKYNSWNQVWKTEEERRNWPRIFDAVLLDYVAQGPGTWHDRLTTVLQRQWRELYEPKPAEGSSVSDPDLRKVYYIPMHSVLLLIER